MISIKLKIDNRENKLRELLKDDSKLSEKIIYENLEAGDFIYEIDNIPVLVMERKTLNDLAMSIKDGRWRNQRINLLQNYQRRIIYYIIEGSFHFENEDYIYCGLNKKILMSSLMNCMIRDDIKIIWTKDILETKHLLIYLTEKLEKDCDKLGLLGEERENKRDIIQIHKEKSTNLSQEKFFKNCLLQIPGISSISSESIILCYPSYLIFYESLKNLSDEERINKLSGITCGEKKRKLSKTAISNLVKYFFI